MSSDPLRLRTLGNVGLYAGESGELILGPGKTIALILYLALTPGRSASREFLLDLLWADLDLERGRRALRQALFQLRRLLGESALVGSEELVLQATIVVDREEFFAAIEAGTVETAIELYQGPFLPSFGVPGGAALEHWADAERERTETAFLRCVETVVRRGLHRSSFREALRLARRARDLAPGKELSRRLVLEAAIAGSDLITATLEADGLEQWAAELGVPLHPASLAFIAQARRIVHNPHNQPERNSLVAELTGREREFSAITAAWTAVREGGTRHLHLTAPAGFGKTRLLRDATARLASSGAPVIRLAGNPGDREVPFAFAADLASAILELPGATGLAPASAATLVALNPALSARLSAAPDPAQGEEALRRRIHALGDLIQATAHEQPFSLAVDDVHWIDQPSYRILDAVCNRLQGARVLWITASRPERSAVGKPQLLPLVSLTTAQIGALVTALGALPVDGAWVSCFATRLHEATGGSPLLILETLRLSLDRGILQLENNGWRCLDEGGLVSLLRAGEALRERVRSLPATDAWVLGLLATAGCALDDETLSAAAGMGNSELARAIEPLEHQGLVHRAHGGWSSAHDEIAAAALDAFDPEQRVRADRAIGMTYARTAVEPHRMIRAARHLAAADDQAGLSQLYRRFAGSARSRGDRRSFGEIAREFVGGEADARRLVSRLPLSWRLGLWSPSRQAAAVALVLILPIVSLMASKAMRGDALGAQRLVYLDSLGITSVVTIHPRDWDDGATPFLPKRDASAMTDAARSHPELPPAVSPDGRSVAWVQDTGDSNTLDIWLRTPAGTKRLTNQARDDLVDGWLPDGSALIGVTNRWSPPGDGDYDLAVFDTATGQARQLTHGPAHENHPFVSPDGTRIGFIRIYEDAPPRLCVVAVDGDQEPDCRLVNGHPMVRLIGWSGLTELVAIVDEAEARTLVRYDWLRNVSVTLLGPHVDQARMSPDGRYVVVANRVDGIRGTRDWVVPIADPARARPVGRPGDHPGAIRWWEGNPDRSLLIDRLELSDSITELMAGIGTRLRFRPLTLGGDEVPVRARVRWSVSDTAVAVVDSAGVVRVRSPGDVTVSASLGGWRSVSRRFHVVGAAPVTVLDEQWDNGWLDRWLPWGDPLPLVVTGPGGVRSLWNHGDGSYPSTALLLRGLTVQGGLGVEVRLSTPITNPKWQRMRVLLAAGLDPAAFRAADPRKAPPEGRAEALCGVTFPGENKYGENQLAVNTAVARVMDLGERGTQLRSGAWWTLRLQILPDGRCGVALNGKPLWISPEPVMIEPEYWLRLGDESADTRILHGPLTIWTGVRTDIDWSAVP